MNVTFKSWDYDTKEIIVEIKCAHCGITERKSLSEIAQEMDEENPTLADMITFINTEYPHWKECTELNREYDGEHD